MKIIKKIKFVAPSKILPSSKEDFMTKLKPVLGQNQINLPAFVADFNKKTHFLNDAQPIEVAGEILKLSDKSLGLRLRFPGASLLKPQWPSELEAKHLQDVLRLRALFDAKANHPSQPLPRLAKVLLSNLRACQIQIKND